MNEQKLIDAVIARIREDICVGDVTALELLLTNVPQEQLIAYLPESLQKEFV